MQSDLQNCDYLLLELHSMEHLVDPVPIDFYKHNLGVGDNLTIVYDDSFLKWFRLKEGNSPSSSLNNVLNVENYTFVTTWCVQHVMKDWYKPSHKSSKVAERVKTSKNLICVCDHRTQVVTNRI
ncbi:hypothetical protein HanPI659440_Chr11g0431511 [Helianthus annuus]|nr:hypothetical protein HanPI659440_Chr11g0431511 [Helianthus annuus]